MTWNITDYPQQSIDKKDEMSIRDKFAIEVLNGLLSTNRGVAYLTLVRESYEIADMMLEQRNKSTNTNNKD